MRFAAIETSTQWCSVALWSDGEVASLERFAGQRHSELVLPMLESLFKDRKIEIDAVAFGAGPGSFTGLRIACALTQGLALPRALPVLGVSTLEALAEESGARRVAACIDARMREVYYAALERQGAHWREAIPAQCLPPDAVPRPVGDGWVGCGSGFDAYGDLGFARILAQVHPTAAAVAALAAPRLAAGEGVDAALAAPVYLRDKVALTKEEQAAR
jgi:tRNA threonylcarbamoyladenosine biosynthesis protein TsaB